MSTSPDMLADKEPFGSGSPSQGLKRRRSDSSGKRVQVKKNKKAVASDYISLLCLILYYVPLYDPLQMSFSSIAGRENHTLHMLEI